MGGGWVEPRKIKHGKKNGENLQWSSKGPRILKSD